MPTAGKLSGATTGFVYFIGEGSRGPVKVGWTIDPARRLATLQIGNSRALKVIGLIRGHGHIEARWHQRFAGQRMGGEWFKRSPEMIAAIEAERTHRLARHSRDGRTTRLERIIPCWSMTRWRTKPNLLTIC